MTGLPRPVQARIPLLLGGGGPRMMRLAAARADIVGLVPQSLRNGGLDWSTGTEAAFDTRITALEEAVLAAGRADGGPERSILVFDLWPALADAVADGSDPAVAASSPYVLIGDPSSMADAIVERHERWGISYVVAFASDGHVERFHEVVRRLAS
jgi:alkanesulfonate monooxygenase SsuD/methylene tetrahydromethanopterin reductase-like flavin-dependent oxidoreductase (luciferase family)